MTDLKPVRLLWLTKGLGRGGTERLLVDAATLLNRDSFDVEVAFVLSAKDALVAELEASSIAVHCLGQGVAADVRWVKRLRALVHAREYALVHTHAPIPAVAVRVALGRPRPIIIHTEHNVWERYHRLTYWSNSRTYARNRHVFAVSEAVAQSIARNYRPRKSGPTVEVLHHGIQLSPPGTPSPSLRAHARRSLGLPDAAPVVGTVANLTEKKDLSTLLRAFAKVLANSPDARLVIVGAGVLEERLRREAQDLGVAEATLWAGSRPDVRALLPAFDVFALTSRFEGLPIAMLEAMAAGLPVVTTPVGGIGELVTDGREGMFAPVGDAGAIAGHICGLFEDEGERRSLGAAAASRSRDFDISPAVRRIEQVYGEVLPR